MSVRQTMVALWMVNACACATTGGQPSTSGGQTGSESGGCVAVSTEQIALDEDTRLGFSGRDVLALAQGQHATALRWTDGAQTPLIVTVESDATSAELNDMAWKAPPDGREIAPAACDDVLAVAATLRFVTEDGAFDERFALTLISETGQQAQADAQAELSDLAGDYTVTEVDVQGRRVRLFWQLTFDSQRVRGRVDLQLEDLPDGSADQSVSAEGLTIATF